MSTPSNGTNSPVENGGFPPVLILLIALQQIMFLLACFGNGFVIFVFTKYLKLKSMTNKFVVSLASADCMTGIFSGIQLFYFLYPSLNNNMVLCFLRYQVLAFLTTTSQLTVTFTTFDRYIAICHPHKYTTIMSNRTANILLATAWTLPLVVCTIPFTGAHKWTETSLCRYDLMFHESVYLIVSIINLLFGLAAFIMYVFILRKAWVYYKRVRPGNAQGTKPMGKDVRGAKVIGFVTVAFTICWTPFTIFQFKYGLGIPNPTKEVDSVANYLVFLGIFNSVINPFIYAWQRKDFNSACKKLFCCKTANSERFVTNVSTVS